MNEHTLTRVAIWLSVFNLSVTVVHVVHDMIAFASIRAHIEQHHPDTSTSDRF